MESTRNLETLHTLRNGVFLTRQFLLGQYTRTAGLTRQEITQILTEDDREKFLPLPVRQRVEQLLAARLLWSDADRPGFVSTLTPAQIAGFLHASERDAESAHRLEAIRLPEGRPPVCRDAPLTIAQFLEMAGVSLDMLIDVVPHAAVNMAAWFDLGPGTTRAVLEIRRPEVTYRLHSRVEEVP